MAAGVLPAPGEQYGPCVDEKCVHTDCAATRAMATGLCSICGEPIGYGVRFYSQSDNPDPQACDHAACVESQLD
jgi:hypothetical protein